MIDLEHMAMARRISESSPDPSTKCGAVLASNVSGVLGTGYNTPPVAFLEALDAERGNNKFGAGPLEFLYMSNREFRLSVTVHAEINALADALVSGSPLGLYPLSGLTMYVWPIPSCGPCMARMAQEGVRNLVVMEPGPAHTKRWQDSWHHAHIIASACGINITRVSAEQYNDWEKGNA